MGEGAGPSAACAGAAGGEGLRPGRGMEVTPEGTAFEAMAEVCLGGPGPLWEGRRPRAGDGPTCFPVHGARMSRREWAEAGKPQLLDRAIARKNEILSKAGSQIDPAGDAAIRARFNIHFR